MYGPQIAGPRARILVSACLLGERVRYAGRDARSGSALLDRWQAEGRVVPFCPEVAAGLGVPRPAAEIRDGRVRDREGHDRFTTALLRRSGVRVFDEGAIGVADAFLRGLDGERTRDTLERI